MGGEGRDGREGREGRAGFITDSFLVGRKIQGNNMRPRSDQYTTVRTMQYRWARSQ